MGDSSTATVPERIVRPEFTGSAGEYFRIWIVNLFFTLATLGVYSAWAKVRKRRYFYGSTRLDGDSFDYFASPKAVLKGRIVALVLFMGYALAGEVYPPALYGFWIAAALALPWLIVKAMSFNARNSAYRGLRFDFQATSKNAVRIYFGMLLLVIVTAGLAFPWFMAKHKAFIASRHALGLSAFRCDLPVRAFYGIYFRAGMIVVALAVPGIALGGFITFHYMKFFAALPESIAWLVWLLPVVPVYVGYAIAYAYVQARAANLFWSRVEGEGLRFSSTLSVRRLIKLYFGNLLAIACTAGLLIPWAVVRTLRYRLENFSLIVSGNPVFQSNPALQPVGASSQELGDFFNMDVGV